MYVPAREKEAFTCLADNNERLVATDRFAVYRRSPRIDIQGERERATAAKRKNIISPV